MEKLKSMKPANELELIEPNGDDGPLISQMYDSGAEKLKSIELRVSLAFLSLVILRSMQYLFPFKGHSGPVHSLSFSCERRLLLSSSRDATLRLWNL